MNQEQKPQLTISGYRGIWGDTLTEEIAKMYARAYLSFIVSETGKKNPTIILARDGRESGPILLATIKNELVTHGARVIDTGLTATPIALFLVKEEKTDGAVVVTASHNPIEYNGLKFVSMSGTFTTKTEVEKIKAFFERNDLAPTGGGTAIDGTSLYKKHTETILKNIDVELVRSKKFKIALDPINSVGCIATPELLSFFDAEVSVINGEPNGKFAHEPEPLPKNLSGLAELVKEKKCDVGFAQDPDGDRLVICDENGVIPSEEVMLALCVKAVMQKNPGTVVINLSTSNMSEDIVRAFGRGVLRSPVGEANVVERMMTADAIVGGEGGGGIIWPTANMARDSFVGIALILELMAKEGKPISVLISELPKYFMQKEKMEFNGSLPDFYAAIKIKLGGVENNEDGLRLDFPDRSWVHIRPSNTEPIIRIIAEATTKESLTKLIESVRIEIPRFL